jgi:hypothetical protein
MKKKVAILATVVAFVIGFGTGITIVILKGKPVKSMMTLITPSPIAQEPISIELMEKIEDL